MSTVVPTASSATSNKTSSDPAYASTNLGAVGSSRLSHESSSISRARPGLRGTDHPVVGGSGRDGVVGADSACCRQHDIPKHDKQSHSSRKKAPMKSWRHKLNVCRYPSIESIESVVDVRPNFRRTSSDHGSLAEACATASVATHNNLMVASGELETAAGNSSDAPTTNKRTTRNSPFCPCFSPTDSDQDEDEPIALASSGSHRPTMEQHAPSRSSSCRRQIIHMARDIRSRLVVAGDAANQTAGPSDVRRLGDGMLMSDQPYPVVHTTVGYTHYFVPDMLQITNAPYYWGVMDRFEAEKLLDGKPEGTFLLRDSAQSDYMFSVSFRRYQRTLHARIEEMNHRFSFDSYDSAVFSASTVTELIDNYKDPSRCLFFEPQLTHPLHRTFVFPLQHLCRATIAARLNYNDLTKLPAPRKIKEYLREYHYKHAVHVTNNESSAEHSG